MHGHSSLFITPHAHLLSSDLPEGGRADDYFQLYTCFIIVQCYRLDAMRCSHAAYSALSSLLSLYAMYALEAYQTSDCVAMQSLLGATMIPLSRMLG